MKKEVSPRRMMKSKLTLLLLMAIIVATGDNPSKADLTDKDDDKVYCHNINVDANNVSYEVVDRDENTIALNWEDAFKKDNVEGFTVADCVLEVVVDYGYVRIWRPAAMVVGGRSSPLK